MLIGAMNHPGHDVLEEIEWMAAMGLDFVDLTIEPPRAGSWQVDPEKILASLRRHGLRVVGHTAYYLPLASPFEDIRKAAMDELRRCLRIFQAVGARWMNIHPDSDRPLHSKEFCIDKNLEILEVLLAEARKSGIGVMVENIPGEDFNSIADLGILLGTFPELGLHLDIGHCNLSTIQRNAEGIISRYADRLRHVHLHDNKGGTQDLHLPLGTGTMDIAGAVRALRANGFDGTITLEVFSPDRHYLEYSRDLLRRMWDAGD
jgi:sugar phosphate isomerase/epimerase